MCGGVGTLAVRAWDRNRETTDERFTYDRCEVCATVYLVDVPPDLARYYDSDYHGFGDDGEPEWKGNALLMRSEAYRVELLRRHTAPGRLIEIGAGAGGFASAAHNAGFEVTAIEMNARCCDYLSEQVGVRAICSDQPLQALSRLPAAGAIALWHVFEHLPDPARVLECLAEKLEPGGVLALGVPNPRSLQFRLLGARWPHLDAPRHLCLVPPDALVARASELGLSCVVLTTADPFGLHCDLFGWMYGLHPRPAQGVMSKPFRRGAQALTLALAPIERRGRRGSAVTVLLRKDLGVPGGTSESGSPRRMA
jgi:SAM-dependent methyltransferase